MEDLSLDPRQTIYSPVHIQYPFNHEEEPFVLPKTLILWRIFCTEFMVFSPILLELRSSLLLLNFTETFQGPIAIKCKQSTVYVDWSQAYFLRHCQEKGGKFKFQISPCYYIG